MYEVTDMYLVAALMAYGAEYEGVDRKDLRNQKFLFKSPIGVDVIHTYKHKIVTDIEEPSFDQIKQSFDTCTLLFPPNYSEVLRRVKGIIHT